MRKRNLYILSISLGLLSAACNKKKEEGKMVSMPGMDMTSGDMPSQTDASIELDTNALKGLLRPTSEFVLSSLPVTTLRQTTDSAKLNVLGSVQHDNRHIRNLSSRIAGRIEKLYVKYRYQYVNKGQKVFEIYSPELLTDQQNLIFLVRNDAGNSSLIEAARQRLLLLGMSRQQLAQILRTGKPLYSIPVYSNYSGYVTEPGSTGSMGNNTADMGANTSGSSDQSNTRNIGNPTQTTSELTIKEGAYVEKAQPIFTLIDASHGRIDLSIFAAQQNLVKKGTPVMIVPETAPDKKFRGVIDRIEPFYQPGSKTISARVYFNNANMKLPIGSQVQATIFSLPQVVYTLPASAVVSTGLNNVVFRKQGQGFSPKVVAIGFRNNGLVQIVSGLAINDSVAVNAQHLIESESIINVKK